ncbi:MAG TPA: amino acid--tRNA ligase-related protein [Candidatus Saccharimonadales bacterium]|nr:amino acid--tRNA ligase-related protein [Candidatus Saccharimonadales bacterium]
MATLQDYRDERLRKLQELKTLGVDPYPAESHRTIGAGEIAPKFGELEGQTATVAGRIAGIRKFGKLAFIVLRDQSGQVQLFLRDGDVDELNAAQSILGMKQLPLLDTGDFIEATGEIIKTKTGEISVGVKTLRLLTKSLRPMPTELTNKEERLRRRYVDMNVNEDVRNRFVRRSKFWQATRDYLNENGFVEVNVPVLEHTTGGADANPFVTHMDALDQDFYLRISHELPLKRLIGAGFEKVYDIGPRFRNENYSDEHLPEHVAMEWYWAYANWQDGMKFMEGMYKKVLQETFGTLQFKLDRFEVDMSGEWEVWDYATIIKERYGIDVYESSLDDVKKALADNKLEVEQTENRARGIDKLWKNIRKDVAGPVWLINTPKFISPLAKSNPDDENTVQRFQPVIAGSELGNGFSELNDPIDQLNRFLEQQAMREAGDDEAMMLDIDFVEMLEYGMPPACGWGWSERVFWIFEGVTAREGVPFPQLRTEYDAVTKAVYPDVKLESSAPHAPAMRQEDKPVSAAVEGTKKLYLEDFSLLESDATVVEANATDDGQATIILDQTCMYPGGGGQAHDLGKLTWQDGYLEVTEVSKEKDGRVLHRGQLQGGLPRVGAAVRCFVDAERRLLNSRLHCAGHLIDYAVRKVGKTWKPGRGAHYPHMSFVEYEGEFNAEEAEQLRQQIETTVNDFIASGGEVGVRSVPSNEARALSEYIPEPVLAKYQNVHLATYPDGFNVCCGGTHVTNLSEIGEVKVTKVKRKDGRNRVSYTLAGLEA